MTLNKYFEYKKVVIVIIGILILFSSCNTKANLDQHRPNILFIVSEDNGPELGCYGTNVQTPNLDKLADTGILFENAYVPQAGCSPSRAAFLTGLFPHQNGQIGLATWKYKMYNDSIPNMVNELRTGGYYTGIIGKIHVNPESAFNYEWKSITSGNFQRDQLNLYAIQANEFFNTNDRPFFLQVNYPDAHRPFKVQVDSMPVKPITADDVEPLPYLGLNSPKLKEITANYLNCIMRLDMMVGDLLEFLDKSGKRENTLIVYIGDHGADILRGKRTSYEGGTRIPLIISWPDKIKEKMISEELVSTLDLFPTFLEAIGKEIPDYLPGQSLFPVFKAKPLNRDYLVTEYHVHSNHNPFPQRTIRNERYKLIWNLVNRENPGHEFTLTIFDLGNIIEVIQEADPLVRDAYMRMHHPPEFELYDLKNDPYEWKNLADDTTYQNVFNQLKEELHMWQIETRDPLIDKELALRLFNQIMSTELQKVDIPYASYMDPKIFTEAKQKY